MSRRVEKDSSLGRYLSEIGAYSILTKEQEMEIARLVTQGASRDSLNKLVESNLSFVVKIANEYRNLGLAFEDLLNEGNIGLIEAARRYDHNKGTKFITYAIWWVRKSILKALSEQSNLVRVPSYQMKKVKRIRETEARLSRELGRRPDRDEISRKLESTISKIDEILMIKLREISLDDKVGRDKSIPISDYLVDDASASPEDELLRTESEDLIRSAMVTLTPQEKIVIANRFGMDGFRALTLKEIGETLGLSRERIRQIEAQAKRKLRRVFAIHKYLSSPTRGSAPADSMVPLRSTSPAEGSRRRTASRPAAAASPLGRLHSGGDARRLSLVPRPISN